MCLHHICNHSTERQPNQRKSCRRVYHVRAGGVHHSHRQKKRQCSLMLAVASVLLPASFIVLSSLGIRELETSAIFNSNHKLNSIDTKIDFLLDFSYKPRIGENLRRRPVTIFARRKGKKGESVSHTNIDPSDRKANGNDVLNESQSARINQDETIKAEFLINGAPQNENSVDISPVGISSDAGTDTTIGTTGVKRQQHSGDPHDDRQGKRQSCNFHGNCPTYTSCVPNASGIDENGFDGECLPYQGAGHDQDATPKDVPSESAGSASDSLRACADACYDELLWDEHYFHGAYPAILRTSPALNGHGCVLKYTREAESAPDLLDPANKPTRNVDEWIASRYHRLVRVDPASVSVERRQDVVTWQALCRRPCEEDSDCSATGNHGTNGPGSSNDIDMVCTSKREHERPVAGHPAHPEETIAWMNIDAGKKTCRHRSRTNLATGATKNDQESSMILVSAANSGYYRSLKNLALSLKYWEPNRTIIVYNLGMSQGQLDDVATWSNLEELRWADGIPEAYPEHVRRKLMVYAWKPIIIDETVREFKSIFWLDAGATLTGPMGPVEEIVRQTGMFLVRGQDDDMAPMSHAGTYTWHGFDKRTFPVGPHFGGNTQAHTYPSPYIGSIVAPNAACALDKTCINPDGSHLGNHRFDQTSLSILAYSPTVRAPHYTELLAASKRQLHKKLGKANRMIVWTARQAACDMFNKLATLAKE